MSDTHELDVKPVKITEKIVSQPVSKPPVAKKVELPEDALVVTLRSVERFRTVADFKNPASVAQEVVIAIDCLDNLPGALELARRVALPGGKIYVPETRSGKYKIITKE